MGKIVTAFVENGLEVSEAHTCEESLEAVSYTHLIGGGVAWYFKIYRPKHQQADQPKEDDGGEYPDYDEFEDDGPPWDEDVYKRQTMA